MGDATLATGRHILNLIDQFEEPVRAFSKLEPYSGTIAIPVHPPLPSVPFLASCLRALRVLRARPFEIRALPDHVSLE
jgi:hypothetical protein